MITPLQQNFMALANGKDSDVISERSWDASRSGNGARPWAKQEGNESHAKWAPLRNAAKMPVNFTKASSNSVATLQFEMNVFVCSAEPWREASSSK